MIISASVYAVRFINIRCIVFIGSCKGSKLFVDVVEGEYGGRKTEGGRRKVES